MKKILLIEDVPDTAELVRRILVARGYEFAHASGAEVGLRVALEFLPDLILLDLGLPDYDGQTLSGWIRDEKVLQAVPLVAFTAWPEETARHMVDSYGFDGYIGKPIVNINVFADRVAAFLK